MLKKYCIARKVLLCHMPHVYSAFLAEPFVCVLGNFWQRTVCGRGKKQVILMLEENLLDRPTAQKLDMVKSAFQNILEEKSAMEKPAAEGGRNVAASKKQCRRKQLHRPGVSWRVQLSLMISLL